MNNNTRRITGLALLAAMSVILVYIPFLRFPIIPAAAFLEYDAADVPIMIGAFLYGPVWGLLLIGIVAVIQGLTVSAASGFYGILMHFLATGIFVMTAGLIYKYKRTIQYALLGLCAGVVSSVIIMVGGNLLITPLFLGTSVDFVVKLLIPAIIPFNLIKFGINATVCFLLYKRIHKAFNYIMDNYNKPFKKFIKNKDNKSKVEVKTSYTLQESPVKDKSAENK